MILIVTCTCGGAEGLARTALKNGGVSDWLTRPIAQGKPQTKVVLDMIRPTFANDDKYKALCQYVEKAGRYVIVVGYDPSKKIFEWRDFSRGTIKERLDAEILIKEFA